MSDINDRLNGDDIEISRRDVRERVSNIIYTNSEATDGDVLQYNSSTGLFSSVTPNAAGLYVEGGTDLPVTDGGTGASTASGARTNLGIGTIATQNSNNVTITGGSVTGITDLAVADGGTGASTLTGVVIGNGTSAFTAQAPLSVSNGGTGASTHTSGSILIGNGTSAVTSQVSANVADGGTGLTSATAYAVLCGGTASTGAFQSIASVGTSGQVFTSNGAGALPTFQAAPAYTDSQWTFISTQSASSSSSIDFTGLSSTYKSYMLIVNNLKTSTDGADIYARLEISSFQSSNYTYVYKGIYFSGDVTPSDLLTGGSASSSQILLGGALGIGNASTENGFLILHIDNPSQTSVYCITRSTLIGLTSTSSLYRNDVVGMYTGSTGTAVTGVRILPSGGNIASGTFTLYGLKAS